MTGATRSVEIHAPIERVYDVIVDYEAYPEFLSTMSGVRVLERDADRAVVEFEVDLIKHIRYTLELVGERPIRLDWNLTESRWLRRNTGSWVLADLGAQGVRATYSLDLDFELLVPRGITSRLAGTSLPQTLDAFRKRAEGLST